ncbi:hypothetical protein HN51_027724 [Arachis hypogaea]|uniref:Protein NIM1-INTERACTING n=1 Tax=Arachis hypogaea TaxID=3818 RepID=A0A445BLS6_ARAHY|nr:uncharacterized protein LOC112710592 [Arachis hypogaea]XP_057732754.1 uncharacterized protein LOC130948067 [Arachis stenosperma]QHO34146.1 uncharacterized protein DS421_9g264460 [Arachis hypogaea]RYR39623.1 hypothetical protein Ahy_A09g045190 [Arachis hypogaea]
MEHKKRGVVTNVHDDDDSGDEAKMEKFYSLLRRFRDARDRRKSELKEMEKHERNVKKMKTSNDDGINKKAKTTTTTTAEDSFELQDFTTEIEFRKPPSVFPNPVRCDTVTDARKGKKEQRQQDRPLDLKLTL